MLKKHKNALLDVIKAEGLSEYSFRSREADDENCSSFIIDLHNSPLSFHIYNPSYSHYALSCSYTRLGPSFPLTDVYPADAMDGYDVVPQYTDIGHILPKFRHWLKKDVKDYLDDLIEPDYWSQINEQNTIVSGALISEEEISAFAENEKAQLRLSINEFRLLITDNFRPSIDQSKIIDARLQYLSHSLDRLNRIDWRGLAISTVLSISIALSLDVEKGKMLFALFKKVFTNVMNLLQ